MPSILRKLWAKVLNQWDFKARSCFFLFDAYFWSLQVGGPNLQVFLSCFFQNLQICMWWGLEGLYNPLARVTLAVGLPYLLVNGVLQFVSFEAQRAMFVRYICYEWFSCLPSLRVTLSNINYNIKFSVSDFDTRMKIIYIKWRYFCFVVYTASISALFAIQHSYSRNSQELN